MTVEAWVALRKAVREAHALGAEFRIVGADIEIAGDLPAELRNALPGEKLRQYLGAARADREAIDFLEGLGVEAVLVTDIAGADAAMAELDGAEVIGLDMETAAPAARPEPVAINKDGSLASRQPKQDGGGLDPHTAAIQTLQLYGTDVVYVLRGPAIQHVINSAWIREQRLVAHNAGFELAYLRRHSSLPEGVKARYPVDCTMQVSGLLYGCWNRSLATTSVNVLGVDPPKALRISAWAAPTLSQGQITYAASDSVLAHDLWQAMRPVLEARGRLEAYRLQRNAIPAVADMELRGLG